MLPSLPHWARVAVRTTVWVAVIGPLPWLVWLAVSGGLGANPIESLLHRTGHYTLRLLMATLAVTPLVRATGYGWLMINRRTLGVGAYAWALTHLTVYVGLDLVLDLAMFLEDLVKRTYITVGMLAIGLLTPLVITSTRGWIVRLGGAKWRRLHRLIYPAVLAGLAHHTWAVKKDLALPIMYFAIIVALLLARLLGRGSVQQRHAQRTGASA